ncbi:MAG: hypothetical protein RML93_01145 [Anaerolineales bacterium]|nr:hypothetical protein [Anaerolineales bacterium]MCS7249163.1 hypothetical protein [Anaerolineales bacterium]MDW8162976.1 hypothetical protein [Anaerolineales bacterium]MDW8445877.1 hypothetical protein [Anaerolineales bacterium]
MSWDVILMHVPSNVASIQELPRNFTSELGPRPEILATLARILPALDLTDPSWGYLKGKDFSIEFNIGDESVVDAIILHVRGSDDAVSIIQHLCEQTGWRAFDTTAGDFMNFSQQPATGLQQWRAFRDQVRASLEAKEEKVQQDETHTIPTKKKKWWRFWK